MAWERRATNFSSRPLQRKPIAQVVHAFSPFLSGCGGDIAPILFPPPETLRMSPPPPARGGGDKADSSVAARPGNECIFHLGDGLGSAFYRFFLPMLANSCPGSSSPPQRLSMLAFLTTRRGRRSSPFPATSREICSWKF